MIDFALHPNIYATGSHHGLRHLLEDTWIRTHTPGDGTMHIIAGFANYNGGARFYKTFKEHTERGGRVLAILGGSASQRTSSRQVVEALLDCGAQVNVTNRKSLMHAKCYGISSKQGQKLIVTSGNFTGPGMSQNVEAALAIGTEETSRIGFSWDALVDGMLKQSWVTHQVSDLDISKPYMRLLYDETPGVVAIDQSEESTMVLKLGHADTARIMADFGSTASLGTQYFWLSKDAFDFFPPLTIRNQRGYKGTLSAFIQLHYVDLTRTANERVTFEAQNNLDFRLGTGMLRHTKLASHDDLACISRISETEYELRIIKQDSKEYSVLLPYAVNFIGHQGKRYGYVDNVEFERLLGIRFGKPKQYTTAQLTSLGE